MDILIKNMEMPKSCITGKLPYYEYCPFFGSCSKASAKTERPSDCPLVALPEHGDLKDANAILRWLNAKADNRVPVTVGEIIDFIEKQTIIVEATE